MKKIILFIIALLFAHCIWAIVKPSASFSIQEDSLQIKITGLSESIRLRDSYYVSEITLKNKNGLRLSFTNLNKPIDDKGNCVLKINYYNLSIFVVANSYVEEIEIIQKTKNSSEEKPFLVKGLENGFTTLIDKINQNVFNTISKNYLKKEFDKYINEQYSNNPYEFYSKMDKDNKDMFIKSFLKDSTSNIASYLKDSSLVNFEIINNARLYFPGYFGCIVQQIVYGENEKIKKENKELYFLTQALKKYETAPDELAKHLTNSLSNNILELISNYYISTNNRGNSCSSSSLSDKPILLNVNYEPLKTNFTNSCKTFIDTIKAPNSENINFGININMREDVIADSLSHRINYFNMDKYFGIGVTQYSKNTYFNQLSFFARTRIDESRNVQPLVFSSLEAYQVKGANFDFGISINNFSDSDSILHKLGVGIYTGAEYIRKFGENKEDYWDWEIGLTLNTLPWKISKRNNWSIGGDLRLPVTYRSFGGKEPQESFSPQLNLIVHYAKIPLMLQLGGQYHTNNNDLIGWAKLFIRINKE